MSDCNFLPRVDPRVAALKNVEVDPLLLTAWRRRTAKLKKVELQQMADKALDAWQNQQEKVVITSASFEGGSTAGQIVGNPLEMVKILEILLAEREGLISATDAGAGGASAANAMGHGVRFNTRRVET